MDDTANLQLPYIMPAQAQKHVTHNEALTLLDAIVQLAVLDRDLSVPPATPDDGDRFIVAAGATGAWTGWEGGIALRADGAWLRIEPRAGWLAWVADEAIFVRWTGSEWVNLAATFGSLQELALLGIGTTADGTNPLSAKLNNALWTARYAAEGGTGDLRYTMNKELSSGTLSLLLQTGWSGRAEIGLTGSDNLAIKVSADGATWRNAITVDAATGKAGFPQTAALDAVSALTPQNGAFVRFTGSGTASMQAILGTVAQSGGVPTGAIVETGSNANGRYMRWADGTQIVTKTISGSIAITDPLGALFQSPTSILSGSYPLAFGGGAPVALVSTAGSIERYWPIAITAAAAGTGPAIRLVAPVSQASVAYTLHLAAIGRWF